MFRCTKLRLCSYLMDKGFYPCQIVPDEQNPKYKIYLFEETTALKTAVTRYFSTDCFTAQKRNIERMKNYETNELHTEHKRNV